MKGENYLTESHKIKGRITKERALNYLVLAIIFVVIGWIFVGEVHDSFLPEPLKTVKKKWEQVLKTPNMPIEEEIELKKEYEQVKKEIDRLYPMPTVFNIFKESFYGHKGRAVIELFILAGLPIVVYAGAFIWLSRKSSFFYQVAEREPVSNLPDKPPYPVLHEIPDKYRKELWKDFDQFHIFLASGIKERGDVKFNYEEAKKEINELVDVVKKYFERFYPTFDKEKLDILTRVILWHYLISFYGNVPTGTLSIYIKDPTLKIALSSYNPKVYRKPRIYYYDKLKNKVVFYENKIEPYVFLEGLYGADRESKIFDRIADKFCPLPFNPFREIF